MGDTVGTVPDTIIAFVSVLRDGHTRTIQKFIAKNYRDTETRLPFFDPVYAANYPLDVRSIGGAIVILATEGQDDGSYALERLSLHGDILVLEKKYINIPLYLQDHDIDPSQVTSDDTEQLLKKDFKHLSHF